MSKHTPGPWGVIGEQSTCIWDGEKIIAFMADSRKSHENARDNAILMAASPDLLTHLKHCSSLLGAVAGDLIDECERNDLMPDETAERINELKKARDEAQALIAKVEG